MKPRRMQFLIDNTQRCVYSNGMENGEQMTPEERLANIEEKHQALAMHVEVLAGMQTQTENRIARLAELQAANEERLSRLIETVSSLAESTARLDNGMERMVRIVDLHEDRIHALEEKRS